MIEKLEKIKQHFDELSQKLTDPELISNNAEYKKVAKEHSGLEELMEKYAEYKKVEADMLSAQQVYDSETDAEMRELANTEVYECKDKLKEMCLYIEKHPDAQLYSHWYTAQTAEDEAVEVGIDEREDYLEELAVRNFIGSPTFFVDKDAFNDVGGLDEQITALEDWEFLVRFASKYKIRVVPKSLMQVDLISEGMSSDIGKYYDSRCYIIAKNRQILLERNLFDKAVESLLISAKKNGVLENVGRILEAYLK